MGKQAMVHDFTEATGHWKNQTMCLKDGTVVMCTKENPGNVPEIEVYTLDRDERDGSVLRGSFLKKPDAVLFAEYLSLQSAGTWDLIELTAWLFWRKWSMPILNTAIFAALAFAAWFIT